MEDLCVCGEQRQVEASRGRDNDLVGRIPTETCREPRRLDGDLGRQVEQPDAGSR